MGHQKLGALNLGHGPIEDAADYAHDVVFSTGEDDRFIVTGTPKKIHDAVYEGTIFGTKQPTEYQQAHRGDQYDIPAPGLYNFGRSPVEAVKTTATEVVEAATGNWDWTKQGGGSGGNNLALLIVFSFIALLGASALGQLVTYHAGGQS